jgi:hypothetical protein
MWSNKATTRNVTHVARHRSQLGHSPAPSYIRRGTKTRPDNFGQLGALPKNLSPIRPAGSTSVHLPLAITPMINVKIGAGSQTWGLGAREKMRTLPRIPSPVSGRGQEAAMMKNLHQDGKSTEMGEIALALKMVAPTFRACPEHRAGTRKVGSGAGVPPVTVMARMALSQRSALQRAAGFHDVIETKWVSLKASQHFEVSSHSNKRS